MYSLIFFKICIKLSVPICGFDVYKISSGAPNLTNVSKTVLQYTEFIPVVSLPSEKVPAPPSPNWIFEFGFKIPVLIKLLISFWRSSTDFPCSTIIGKSPFSTKVIAANKPAGPAPIITGRLEIAACLILNAFCDMVSFMIWTFFILEYLSSFFVFKSNKV